MRAIAMTTLRGLLGRRRMILLLLLAGLPVLVALLIRIGGGRADATGILDTLGIRTILPLVALVVGTASIGSGDRRWDAPVSAHQADPALARPRWPRSPSRSGSPSSSPYRP
ncbi:MAG: hypothetical protein WKF78_00765 [Candidatus Limnocylindrales bacterium]